MGFGGDGEGGAVRAGKAYPLSSDGGVGWSWGVPLVKGESGCLCFCFCEREGRRRRGWVVVKECRREEDLVYMKVDDF